MRYGKLGVAIAASALVAFFFSVLPNGTLENLRTGSGPPIPVTGLPAPESALALPADYGSRGMRKEPWTTCGPPIPLARLPDHVAAVDSDLTLYADYGDVRGDYVVLYLVNRTDRDLAFYSQDDDIYVKLETLSDFGYWERVERHWYSDCGNSYFAHPRLNAGYFFQFLGYSPRNGEKRTVRYRMYNSVACAVQSEKRGPFGAWADCELTEIDLVSGQTEGFVLPEEVEQCRSDRFSASNGCFEVVARIAADLTIPFHGGFHDAGRSTAIRTLQRFGDGRSLEVLQRLLDDDDDQVRVAAVEAITMIVPKLNSAAKLRQQLLNDEDSRIRAAAIRGLEWLPELDTMVPYLEELLEEPALEVRVAALFNLILLAPHCNDALSLVEGLFCDPDPTIREIVEVNLRIIDDRMANPEKFRRSDELWAAARKSSGY